MNNVRVNDGRGKPSVKEGFCFEVFVKGAIPSHLGGSGNANKQIPHKTHGKIEAERLRIHLPKARLVF